MAGEEYARDLFRELAKQRVKKRIMRKKATTKDIEMLFKFKPRDRVVVNYRTKWFDLIDVPAIIMKANRASGYPFKLKLEDSDGKPINLGHDDDGGAPGSGPFMYCKDEHMKIVESYTPKKLEGEVREEWKLGDRFMPKSDLGLEQDEHDDNTGITEDMLEKCSGVELTVKAILNRCGVTWLLDGTETYMWLPEWVDPIVD